MKEDAKENGEHSEELNIPEIPEEVKKKLDELKSKLDHFRKDVLKEFSKNEFLRTV